MLHKKIRFLRLNKGWSQETMAEKLDMSPNGYGSIERGETNVQLSRVLQIAELFDINVSELFQDTNGKNVLDSMGSQNIQIQNNNCSPCHFGVSEKSLNQSECQHEREQLEFNLEKQIMITERQKNEILLLKQINELLAPAKLASQRVFKRRSALMFEEPQAIEPLKENKPQFKINLGYC